MIPEHLRYTTEHEWVSSATDDPVQVGITHFAQDSLGDVVYVQLPDPGLVVAAGEPLGEVESTKSVSEIYAPVSGTVVSTNSRLASEPELINSDPYGAGWIVQMEPADRTSLDGLLDASGYRALTES